MSIYKQPGSDNWYVEFQTGGERVRQSTGTADRKEAEKIEAELKAEVKRRQKGGFAKMTLLTAFEKYGDEVVSRGSNDGSDFASKTRRICGAGGLGADRQLDDLTTAMITAWAQKLEKGGKIVSVKGKAPRERATSRDVGLKASTINLHLTVLASVLKKANRSWKTLLEMPVIEYLAELSEDDSEVKALSKADEVKLLRASPMHLRQLLKFLFGTGARKSEAFQLVWDNVINLQSNAEHAEVKFEHAPKLGRTTKTRKSRVVPLPQSVRDLLIAMRDEQKALGYTGDHVFVYPHRRKGAIVWDRVSTVKSAFEAARKKAKLDWVTMHMTRHTYASRLLGTGKVQLIEVSRLLGHTSVATTEIYAHFMPGKLGSSVALLDAIAA